MKILFYFGGFARVGGIETFCKNLLCYLQRKNYSCSLVCWGQESPLLQHIEQSKIKVLRTPWRWGCRWKIPDWLLLFIGLQQIEQANIVLFGKLFPIEILKRLRLQASPHTTFVYITPYQPFSPKAEQKKRELLKVLNIFDLILVQAPVFQQNLRQIGYQGQIEIVPLMAQQSGNCRPFPPQEQLRIGFLGRLVEDKNIPLLIEAFHYFQNQYLQIFINENEKLQTPSLHLFGDGYLRQQLEKQVDRLGIKSSVMFHGNIQSEDITNVISSCHFFAFTSRIEGQCLAALEILSCGRPIVATDVGALPDILSDKRLGRIVKYSNYKYFADTLVEMTNLIQKEHISPEIIRAAYFERYAPEIIGSSYEKILTSCLKNN